MKRILSWFLVLTLLLGTLPALAEPAPADAAEAAGLPAVGDVVEIEPRPDGTAWITAIAPRRNYIIRRASNLSKEFQIIASNLDLSIVLL